MPDGVNIENSKHLVVFFDCNKLGVRNWCVHCNIVCAYLQLTVGTMMSSVARMPGRQSWLDTAWRVLTPNVQYKKWEVYNAVQSYLHKHKLHRKHKCKP